MMGELPALINRNEDQQIEDAEHDAHVKAPSKQDEKQLSQRHRQPSQAGLSLRS